MNRLETHRLLLVEDNPGDAELIRELLEDGSEGASRIVHVETMAAAHAVLMTNGIDAVLLDLRLPDCSGVDCVSSIRRNAEHAAIVALTGMESDELALACLAAGAQDYIGKNEMRPASLRRAIGYAVARVRENTAQQRATHLRTRLAAIVEGSTDAIISCDFDGRVTSWNRGAEAIFGYTPEEAIGRDVRQVIPTPPGREIEGEQRILMRKAMAGEFGAPREVERLRRDGQLVIISAVAFPLPSISGDGPGFGAICRDITEARAREAELLRAQRLEVLGTLAGGIAHDLNNTMLPITTLGSMLLEEFEGDEEQRESLQLVVDAADRAKTLVRELLNFSRQGQVTRQLIRLDKLAESTLRVIRAGLPTTIHYETRLDRVPEIAGNQSKLYQVLLNLVTNAAQAIGDDPAGTITITVREVAAGTVQLCVEDNGVGMDEETQRRLFEPFFTTKGASEGTGLGLAVVNGIVSDHGGSISVTSVAGAGSRFELLFPAATGG